MTLSRLIVAAVLAAKAGFAGAAAGRGAELIGALAGWTGAETGDGAVAGFKGVEDEGDEGADFVASKDE